MAQIADHLPRTLKGMCSTQLYIYINFYIYINLYLATMIISMEMFSIQCQERKENAQKIKHKIITVVGGFVVFIASL